MSASKEGISSLFLDSLDKVVQGNDALGLYRNLDVAQRLEQMFLVTPEEKQQTEACGLIDPKVKEKIELFFQAVTYAIEQKSGKLVSSIVELNSEGFGRVILYSGRLILVNKSIRGIQKFTFTELKQLDKAGTQYISNALSWLEKYPEIINL